MTIKFFYGNDIAHDLFWNYPNINGTHTPENGEWQLRFKSMHSNTYLDLPIIDLTITGNDRFSKVDFTQIPPTTPKEHINGIYEAELFSDRLGKSYKQIVKIITSPGGQTGTTPYVSNNEDREAVVYYNPEY